MKRKKIIDYLLLLVLIPVIVASGALLFSQKQYAFVSLAVVIVSFVPFIMKFENDRRITTVRMVLIAVMTALSVVGRFAFSYIPHFKPVTAFVIIAGMYLGAQSGFLCGALSAVISNFIFGQGAWTPFQMFAWGIIGFFAGVMSDFLKKRALALYVYGAFSGVVYSLILDTWTALYIDGTFNITRYGALIISALPVTAVYAVSNVIFLLLLAKPLGKRINRMTVKYGIKN